MNATTILAVLIIGFAAGLRALTPPAVIAWCAYLGCINLDSTVFSFMSSPLAVAIFSLLALGEYVGDLLPSAPKRTAPVGLIARVLTGSFTSACLLAVTGQSLAYGILGSIAAVGGAFAGYQMRVRLVRRFAGKDAFVAIPEDFVAVGLSLCAACLMTRL